MIRALLRVLGAEHSRPVRATIALMALTAVIEGAAYALMVPVLGALLGPTPADAWPWLWGFVTAIGLYAALRYVSDLLGFRATTGLLRSMYHRLGDHLARLPVGWFSQQRTGELSVLASRGILDSLGAIAHLLMPYLSACLTPLTIVVVVLTIDVPLGLVAAGAAPVVFWTLRWAKRSMADLDDRRREQEYLATDRTVEFLHAQPLLRAAGRATQRFGLLEAALNDVRRTGRKLLTAIVPATIGAATVVQTTLTVLLGVGAFRVVDGSITAAEVLVVLILANRCVDPLLALSEMSADVRGTEATLADLERVLETSPLPEPTDPKVPTHSDVEFDAVCWRPRDRNVIDQVSLCVREGRRVAVVGPSGAGKSSLLHLIARFHDVDAGTVRVGGIDVRDMGAQTLSRQIAFVFQDVLLLDATIEENIRVGCPEATDDEVRRAASAARLDEVAARLPRGWGSNVGEGGRLLSGGERQRVSIARALLKDAPIVLLDEITAALDPISEAAVHDSIDELTRNRTTIMVAHRLHTIRRADLIVFLDEGSVVESGTHTELVARNGRYAEFLRAVSVDAPPSQEAST